MKNLFAFSMLSAMAALSAAAQDRPNVILIVGDDLGYGDMECYGAKNIETPNVNRLAAEGIRFTNCHATASTSTPSRYGLLTGEYAWRRSDTGVLPGDGGALIRPDQYTIADLFQQNGYYTGAIGKWHLGIGSASGRQNWNGKLDWTPRDIGFSYHYIQAATADRVPCVYLEQDTVANYDPTAPISVSYSQNFAGLPSAADHPEMLKLQSSHGHNQAIVDSIGRIGFMKGGGKALWKDENIADSIAKHSCDFIMQHKDEPFFLYLCTNDPHVPRWPHERFRGKSVMGLRGDALASFDWTVGQVLDALDRAGIADNTLVILTSDNGPVLDDGYVDGAIEKLNGHSPAGPFRAYKYSGYEGGTMVPFIVRWPAQVPAAAETNNTLLSHIDLLASFGSLIGAEVPKGAGPDSADRMAQFLGQSTEDRPWVSELNQTRTLAVRTPQWKYIPANSGAVRIDWGCDVETGNQSYDQLFDMVNDPGETTNVATQNPEVLQEMKQVHRDASKVVFEMPDLSTDTEEHWYTLTTPLGTKRCVATNDTGVLFGMGSTTGFFARGQWKFVGREDGTVDIINRKTGQYIAPNDAASGRLTTTSARPDRGWRIDYAITQGLVVFYTDDLKSQINQSSKSSNNYGIQNWGGGRHDDSGCQFLLTPVEGNPLPEIKLPVTPCTSLQGSTAEQPVWYTICAPLRSSYYATQTESDGLTGMTSTYLVPNLVWRLEERADGTFNIINCHTGQYVSQEPYAANAKQFAMTDAEPAVGWTFGPAANSNYFTITSGTNQFNQGEVSNSWRILNWGGGTNTTDIGCQFRLTDVTETMAELASLDELTVSAAARPSRYHDLLGRPVNRPGHGVYIDPAGRKVIL